MDDSPLDEEDILHIGEGGGGGASSSSNGGAVSRGGSSTAPQPAYDVLNYIRAHDGATPPDHHSGPYANDGRGGTSVLPNDAPYREFDIYPHAPGVNRGSERIVIGASGAAWYTNDHYISFIRME